MAPSAGGNPPNGNGCANRQSVSHSSDDSEQVQTARIDYNIDPNNMAWFRFQADTGLQAAYTDPINPLFNAFSPQPLYSFAAGYTHVFSGHLVNYFNPAFSWYESLFGPADLQKTLAAFPIVLQGGGANAPFTTLGGLDNTWVQGRRASRFFINDNLAWTAGPHELRFGTNSRIFRLNDYDFGEGVVPLVTYTTLPQYIYGVASTASETFPLANSQPYNFLNLDFYAQDTWKLTRTLDLDLRAPRYVQFQSPESTQRRGAPGRVVRFHFPRRESAAEPGDSDRAGGRFSPLRRPRFFSREPPSRGRWRRTRCCAAGLACSATFCRAAWSIWWERILPIRKHFRAVCWAASAETAIAPGVPNSAIDATAAANQLFTSGFARGQLSCASSLASAGACLPPISITAVPDGKLHAPYFMQWSFAVEHQAGNALNLRAQYVGTRAVNQPYQTQVNGYQTVCSGCFAPFPYGQPIDPRFGPVTQLSTGANSHYNGLQLTADKRLGHGLQVQANYTWSRCMDTVSNGGFLPFAAGAILSPLPGELGRQYGPCDYDVRHNLTAQYVYQLPVKFRNRCWPER